MSEEIVTDDSKNEIDKLIQELGNEAGLNEYVLDNIELEGLGEDFRDAKIYLIKGFIAKNESRKLKYKELLNKNV